MAQREALRQLHARLAARLQAARSEDVATAHWLAVEAGARRYLMPLAQAGEIFPWTGVLAVPYTQPWLLGVANLRGTLVAVVDFPGLQGQTLARNEMTLADASLLVFNPALEVHAALLVDRLLGLRGTQSFTAMRDAPRGSPGYWGATYIDAAGADWQEIDLQRLARDPEFLHIRA